MDTISEIYNGFEITLTAEDEHESAANHFSFEECGVDHSETIAKIESGEFMWFTAKVSAARHGVELGSDYLGCCCYSSLDDFKTGGYYEQMRDQAISDAEATLQKLQQPAAGE